ncbi:MAG: hypothetical protein ACTSVI_01955 [Promethearchaeota archaeon]
MINNGIHPITGKIIDETSEILRQYCHSWDDDDIKDCILKAVREEEIKSNNFLIHFCNLSAQKRKNLWTSIFKHVIRDIPEKKLQKKIFRKCKNLMESCISCESREVLE